MNVFGLLLRLVLWPIVWVGRVFFGWNKLSVAVQMAPLGSTLDELEALYGAPVEVKPSEELQGVTEYTYDLAPFHEVVAFVREELLYKVTYWSTHPTPGEDLDFVMDAYADGHHWAPMTEGYLYRRSDGGRYLWCSALPAIGVGLTLPGE